MGSKNKIAKHILPIMSNYRTNEMTWVEPFVGGANMIDKVEGKRNSYYSK
jgi:DNA adenine methylase